MELLKTLIWVVNLISAVTIIVLVLMQHGKGADMGAAFGSGASGSLFGASGSANFLSRSTAVLATVFLVSTLALAYLGNQRPASTGSVLESVPVTVPAAPTAVPAVVDDSVPAAPVKGADAIPSK